MAISSLALRGKWNNAKLFFVHINGADGVLSGPDASLFTSVRNGAGDYSLTAVTAFAEPPYVTALSQTADTSLNQLAPTTTVIRIKGRSIATSPAATDTTIELMIYGCQLISVNAEPNDNHLHSTWKSAKVFSVHINGSDGVLSGPDSAAFASVKNGTGDYTLTPVTTFAAQPYILATPIAADVAIAAVLPTTTAIQVKGRSVAASPAAAATTMELIIIGPMPTSYDLATRNP